MLVILCPCSVAAGVLAVWKYSDILSNEHVPRDRGHFYFCVRICPDRVFSMAKINIRKTVTLLRATFFSSTSVGEIQPRVG
jgi:hypothetical protein